MPSIKKSSNLKPSAKKPDRDRTVSLNRKAYHDYDILNTLEAGIALKGSEIKSIRLGGANIRQAYARVEKGEMWLYNANIARYEPSGHQGHEAARPRKLLLHRRQIDNWAGLMQEKSLTILPLKLYLKRGMAKVELGLARGRKLYDKREKIRERDLERELRGRRLQS